MRPPKSHFRTWTDCRKPCQHDFPARSSTNCNAKNGKDTTKKFIFQCLPVEGSLRSEQKIEKKTANGKWRGKSQRYRQNGAITRKVKRKKRKSTKRRRAFDRSPYRIAGMTTWTVMGVLFLVTCMPTPIDVPCGNGSGSLMPE